MSATCKRRTSVDEGEDVPRLGYTSPQTIDEGFDEAASSL